MPTVEDLLGGLTAHPPGAPRPVGEVHAAARRRGRRRRALSGAAVVLVVAAAGFGIGAAVTADDPGEDVLLDGGPTTSEPPTTAVPTTDDVPPESLTLDPNRDLVDGSTVLVTLAEPASGDAYMAQCSAEVAQPGASGDPLQWCAGVVPAQADALPAFTVRQVLHLPSGDVDCAEPDACILAVRVGGMNTRDDRFAVLRFRDDLPPPVEAEVVVDGDEGTVGDGDALLLTFSGVETGETIHVTQCIPGPTEDETRCSGARDLGTMVQDGPETQLSFTAFHDVLMDVRVDDQTYDPAWAACEPCVLRVFVGERPLPLAELALVMEPTDDPIRPAVTVDVTGPVPGGTVVAMRADGLQPLTQVGVGWCPSVRLVGGGDPACVGSTGPESIPTTVAADGTLSVPAFTIPVDAATSLFGDCSQPGACGVGLDSGDMYSVLALAPVTITP